jgi:hypothetical protein
MQVRVDRGRRDRCQHRCGRFCVLCRRGAGSSVKVRDRSGAKGGARTGAGAPQARTRNRKKQRLPTKGSLLLLVWVGAEIMTYGSFRQCEAGKKARPRTGLILKKTCWGVRRAAVGQTRRCIEMNWSMNVVCLKRVLQHVCHKKGMRKRYDLICNDVGRNEDSRQLPYGLSQAPGVSITELS